MKLKIELSDDLASDLQVLLDERQVGLEQVIELYLRSMVNASARGRTLDLKTVMPFGKYKGATVETIIRAAPDYVRYLLGTERPIYLSAAALDILLAIEELAS